jgi:hypothetical protein
MSYEIVKKVRIENNKVFLTAESNNVYPKYFNEYEVPSLSTLLQEQGETAFNLEMLKMYEQGILQEGNPNKWSRAIERAKNTEEYKKFSWRISDYSENCPIQQNRKSKEYEEFLLNSLNIKPSKEKFALLNTNYPNEVYVLRVTTTKIKFTDKKEQAKVFKYKEDAEIIVNRHPHFKIINLN